MNIWENTVLTDQGRALQAKLLKGQTLKITRVTTGTKKVPVVDLRQQTAVTEGGYDLTLQPARTEGDKTIIPVLLENKGLNESYDLWQVGFYAEDPDEGEILFCLSQASQAKNIPAEAESPGFSITWDFYFNTSDTAPFEVVLDSAGLVSVEQYQVHSDEINKVNGRVDSLNSILETKENILSKKFVVIKNLNNVIENGCYTINPDITTESLPLYTWLTLLVMNSGVGGIIQMAFVVDCSKMFVRTYNAGGAGWSVWKQIF